VENLVRKMRGTKAAVKNERRLFEQRKRELNSKNCKGASASAKRAAKARAKAKAKAKAKPKSKVKITAAQVDSEACLMQDMISVIDNAVADVKDEQIDYDFLDKQFTTCLIFGLEGKVVVDVVSSKPGSPERTCEIKLCSRFRDHVEKVIGIHHGSADRKDSDDEGDSPMGGGEGKIAKEIGFNPKDFSDDVSAEAVYDIVKPLLADKSVIARTQQLIAANPLNFIGAKAGSCAGTLMRRTHGSYQGASKEIWSKIYSNDAGTKFLKDLSDLKRDDGPDCSIAHRIRPMETAVMESISGVLWRHLSHECFDLAFRIADSGLMNSLQQIENLNPSTFAGLSALWKNKRDLENFCLLRTSHMIALIEDSVSIFGELVEMHNLGNDHFLVLLIEKFSKVQAKVLPISQIGAIDMFNGSSGLECWSGGWLALYLKLSAFEKGKIFMKNDESEWSRMEEHKKKDLFRKGLPQLRQILITADPAAYSQDSLADVEKKDLVDKALFIWKQKARKDEELAEEAWNDSMNGILETVKGCGAGVPIEAEEINDVLFGEGQNSQAPGMVILGWYSPLFRTLPCHGDAVAINLLTAEIQAQALTLVKVLTESAGYTNLYVKGIKDAHCPGKNKLGNKLFSSFSPEVRDELSLPLVGKVALIKKGRMKPQKPCVIAGSVKIGKEEFIVTMVPFPMSLVKESGQCMPGWMVRTVASDKMATMKGKEETYTFAWSKHAMEVCMLGSPTFKLNITVLEANMDAFDDENKTEDEDDDEDEAKENEDDAEYSDDGFGRIEKPKDEETKQRICPGPVPGDAKKEGSICGQRAFELTRHAFACEEIKAEEKATLSQKEKADMKIKAAQAKLIKHVIG